MILQNVSGLTVETVFRGRKIVLKRKRTMDIDENTEEGLALINFLTGNYGFIVDRTSIINKK